MMNHSKTFFIVMVLFWGCSVVACSSLDGLVVLNPQKYYYEKVVLPRRGSTKTPEIVQAVLNKDTAMVEALVAKGVKIDAPDPNRQGSSALRVAVMQNFAPVVPTLLKGGADPNFKNLHGRTPVFFAVMHGSDDILEQLLKHGARVDGTYSLVLRGVQGKYTLQDIALYNRVGTNPQRNKQVAAILTKHGAPGPRGFAAVTTNTLNKDSVARLERVAKFFQEE